VSPHPVVKVESLRHKVESEEQIKKKISKKTAGQKILWQRKD